MCSGKENPDSDADLDVDGDDTLEYGKPQYPWGTVGQGGACGIGQRESEVANTSGTYPPSLGSVSQFWPGFNPQGLLQTRSHCP